VHAQVLKGHVKGFSECLSEHLSSWTTKLQADNEDSEGEAKQKLLVCQPPSYHPFRHQSVTPLPGTHPAIDTQLMRQDQDSEEYARCSRSNVRYAWEREPGKKCDKEEEDVVLAAPRGGAAMVSSAMVHAHVNQEARADVDEHAPKTSALVLKVLAQRERIITGKLLRKHLVLWSRYAVRRAGIARAVTKGRSIQRRTLCVRVLEVLSLLALLVQKYKY
jgi:hypothetical protein